jgi:hypothetical protein
MPARRPGKAPARPPLRQVHVWLSPSDSQFLTALARSRDESVSRLLRRVIGAWRARDEAYAGATRPPARTATAVRGGTTAVPEVAARPPAADTGAPRRSVRGSRPAK